MESLQRIQTALRSVGVTPVTPFSARSLEVDLAGVRANIDFLIHHQVSLVYPCGNTGEFSSLSLDEWTDVVENVVGTATSQVVVVPGVGGPLPVAKEMVRRGEQIDVAGFLLMPPHQPHVAESGVKRYWRELMDASSLPIVLYKRSFPSDATLVSMARDPQVVGVKYGLKDPAAFATLVEGEAGSTVWTCGVAEAWAPFFARAGWPGFTSGLGNFAPAFSMALNKALAAQDVYAAMELRNRAVPFEEIRAREGDANNVAAVKHTMGLAGLAGGPVRPPLRDLDEATAAEVEQAVKLLGS